MNAIAQRTSTGGECGAADIAVAPERAGVGELKGRNSGGQFKGPFGEERRFFLAGRVANEGRGGGQVSETQFEPRSAKVGRPRMERRGGSIPGLDDLLFGDLDGRRDRGPLLGEPRIVRVIHVARKRRGPFKRRSPCRCRDASFRTRNHRVRRPLGESEPAQAEENESDPRT